MPDDLPADDARPDPCDADRAADPSDSADQHLPIPPDRAVLDRVVDDTTAVLLVGEDEDELHLPATALPDGVTDGTWLHLDVATSPPTVLGIDHDLTERRSQDVDERLARLRRSHKGGRFG